uniref:AHNAK nucleoprotein 2 n=1 Tax=Sciurus vulgaris TaxID=55149 RepID=A0A8D2B7J5_SCIVU
MCDCFHVVLPTWPGAPGSGAPPPRLQPAPLGGWVTEGPVDEIVRPRPQGSSPVYECTTEAADFAMQEDAPGRRGSSGRRRSWWKRDSADSQVFSRMSHPEEAAEVTMETEVEAGASGYSVTGGGHQGIFVKQVLKDSSAAKLFSLREGDQLLSATIFFDDIKYEDALKILQYSEPYKIQFKIRRKLPATKSEESAVCAPPRGSKGRKEHKDVAEECTETPTKMPEADGDQERLISKPRMSRGRRPQERLSWPKFQAIKGKRGPGPRRSHSSSEACEPGDVSPTRTDTEAQLPEELLEQKAGPGRQRRRKFLNFRLKMGSGQDPSAAGHQGKGAQGRPHSPGVLGETGPWDKGPEDMGAAAGGNTQQEREEGQGLEMGTARLSLLDTGRPGSTQAYSPGTQVQVREVKTSKSGISKEKVPETERDSKGLELRKDGGRTQATAGKYRPAGTGPTAHRTGKEEGTEQTPETLQERACTQDGKDRERREARVKVPRFKMSSLGWSPSREAAASQSRAGREDIKVPRVDLKGPKMDGKGPKVDGKGPKVEVSIPDMDKELPSLQVDIQAPDTKLEGDVALTDKDVSTRDSKFKMPTFKMPSFGLSAPGKALDASLEVKAPKMEADVALLSIQGDLKGSDLSIQLPSTDLDAKTGQVGVTLPEATLPEGHLPEGPAAQTGLKGHLPKVQVPSITMPKVDLKGPQVHIKGPKLGTKGPKGEMSTPAVELEMPSVQVDFQAPDAKLEGNLALADKDVSTRDSKFKMPKFKMPSFGLTAPGKGLDGSIEVTEPKVEAGEVVPSIQGDLKHPDVSIQGPSAEMDAGAVQVGVTLSEATLPKGELPEVQATGLSTKGHFPKVHMPSIQMPKVELKGPQVDIKGPKVDGKGPKVEVSIPDVDVEIPSVQVDVQAPDAKLEGDVSLAEKDMSTRNSKFKMPKFKMPSFGLKAPGKGLDGSTEVTAPKMEAGEAVPSIQGDLKHPDVSIQGPSAEIVGGAVQVGVTLSEATLPEGELPEVQATGLSTKGHFPKVQMPSIQMPKVELKGPSVDIKGPKVDGKGPKVEVSIPDVDVEIPSVQVDVQAPDAKLEGNLALADKDVSTRDSKFKMPKFKMPSFGVSAPGKALDPSVKLMVPKVEAEVALPSIQGDLKSSDLTIQLPSADLDASAVQVGVTLPDATMPKGDLPDVPVAGARLEGHLPKVQMPSIKMPRVDLKGPWVDGKGPMVDGKGPKVEVSIPDVDKELPSLQVDIQAPDTKLEGDVDPEDKYVATRDSKFKMPKFKMPSFGLTAPGKGLDGSIEVTAPKMEAGEFVPSIQGDLKHPDVSIQVPTAEMDAGAVQVGVTLSEATLPKGELPEVQATGLGRKGHFPKVQMPSIQMPKVELKGPQVDIKGPEVDGKGPKVEVSIPDMDKELPTFQVDIQALDTKLEGDVALEDKDGSTRDSKFKMPKFKMPSFGLSAPGKALDASLEVKAPKMEADVALPSIQGDLKGSDLSIQLPSTVLDAKTGQVGVTLPEATLPEGHVPEGPAAQTGLKGHLPKVQVPSITMPKVDLKGPQVHIKGPKLGTKGPTVEMSTPDVEVEMPSVQVDFQAPDAKLEGNLALADKDVSTRDSKFKMPKFKMPSFGLTAPGKGLDGSTEVTVPKVEAGEVVPSIQGDLKHPDVSIQVPTAEMDAGAVQVGVTLSEATLPEGELPEVQATGLGRKGHFPKVQMPSIQMPKVELKGPQVDIKGPEVDGKGPKVEVSIPDMDKELPTFQVDIQALDTKLEGDVALEDKDVFTRDSKFKMPKFKMPSFGLSAPGKALDASLEVKAPKMEADVALPSIQGDLKGSDLSIQLPSTDLDAKTGQVGLTLPEATLPEGHVPECPAAQTGLKGHLPKVQVPSITMPKVDLKGPQVHIKGPKLGTKGPTVEISTPDVEVEMPSMQVDIQAPDAKLEGNLALADKDVSTRDSKFKMPKFKMPSFGVSVPGKALDPSVELTVPKVEAEVALPSIQGDLKSSDLTIQLPSTDLDASDIQVGVTLPDATMPEGELPDVSVAGARLEGHLPKVQMPSIKMPRVDLKGPEVDGKGPKVDGKGPKVEVSIPDVDKELPSLQVDIQAPDTKLEGDVDLADKDVSTRDSKFKMPKFKMPSFGLSAPGKALDASLEVKAPKMEADVALPSIQGDLKGSDLSIQLPSTDLDAKTGQVGVTLPEATLPDGHLAEGPAAQTGLKGHLPKVQVPSITMPKVDLKGPQVHIKGPKLGTKGPTVEMSTPDVEVEMPSVQVDFQAPDAKLEGNLALADKDVSTRDSKFKMPKFKMPSFGLTAPGKGLDGSTEVTVPKMEAGEVVPSIQGDLKHPDVSIQVPTAEMDAGAVQVGVTLSEATLPEGELPEVQATGLGRKGHFPKVQMPSIQMPKVELTGPQVDIKGSQMEGKGPKVEVSIPDVDVGIPSVQVDVQAPDAKLEGDVALADKYVSSRDSKFKMPKFKMPSFGLSAPGKALDVSLEVKVPKMEAHVALPSIQGDLRRPDVSIQLPVTEMDSGAVQLDVVLPEATIPEGELLQAPAPSLGLKGHVPKVQVSSAKMPTVDIKGPKVDVKGPKQDVSTPVMDIELSPVPVDIQTASATLDGDLSLADKDVVTEDRKFTTLDVDTPFPKKELELKFRRPHFKFSKFSLPHNKVGEDSAGLDEGSGVSLLSVSPRPSSASPCGESREPSMSWATSSVDVPSLATSDLPPATFDTVFPGSTDSTLNHTLGPLFSPGAHAECPQPSSCSLQHNIPCSGSETSAVLQVGTVIPVFPTEHRLGPEDTLPPVLHARVTFPKFHKPKFGFSSATAVDAEADAPAADGGTGLSLLCPVEGVDSSGERAMVASLPASQPLSLGVPASPVTEEQLGPPLLGAPAEDADPSGKGSPFKVPRLKLPTFSWSPKKEAMATGDSGDRPEDSSLSPVLDPDQTHTQCGVPISQTEAQTALPPEKEGEKARRRRPTITMPRLSLPKLRASKGWESVPPGGVDAASSSTTGGCDSEATEKARHADGGRDTGVKFGALDGDGGPTQVPQSPGPSVGLAKPNLSASTVKVEASLSEADLDLPRQDRAVRGGSGECGLGDTLVSQSHGERTAPTPPQDVPPAESAEEGTAAGASLAGGQERLLRAASFHTPGGRRPSSREQGASWEQDAAKSCMQAAPAPAEAFSEPGSEEETRVAPRSSEAEAEATAPESESHADVPSRHLGRPGLRLHLPAAPMCAAGPGGRTHPTEDFLPLQMPRERPERQPPPGKGCGEPPPRLGGGDLVRAAASTETRSLQPEGPVKLKASRTDLPSQVSVVSVDQLWEDSVLTVTFPKLKVPRFSFPESSSEADVFFPIVRDVPCVEAGAEAARLRESPGLWGASLLRAAGTSGPGEQPEGPDFSLEAPPVSKVRVHIQESRGESQGITICSGVTGECAGLGAPETFSSQIVRESEIPASTVEMPSYGFSLLKAKIPEPPAQASTYALSQDLGAWEHPGGAPGGDAVPGDPRPDPGEPFEVISTSANLPGPQAFTSEVCSGLQLADGGSDEEPAEILEFPFDSSLEATTQLAGEDRAPKEKPEGKKPSGLLWSWLPNIGFSSMDESSAEAGDDAGRSAPIQTQPGAQSDPEPPKKQERVGWFRFPRLGFSSSPAKKSKGAEAEAGLAEQKLQEEAATFFDARESFSPEEEEDEVAAGAAGARLGSRGLVAASARTALTLLEHGSAGEGPVPGAE